MKTFRALVACLAVTGSLIVSAPAAQAAGACYQSGAHAGYSATYTCQIWRANHLWAMYGPGKLTPIGNVEGVLNAGTSWFVCQMRFGIKLEYGAVKPQWLREHSHLPRRTSGAAHLAAPRS
jgi:hypothetical protein